MATSPENQELKEKARTYIRQYMREYWRLNPLRYQLHKLKVLRYKYLKFLRSLKGKNKKEEKIRIQQKIEQINQKINELKNELKALKAPSIKEGEYPTKEGENP